jgi:acyl-CoA thioesterase
MSQHPFAKLIDLRYLEQGPGHSRCRVTVDEKHLNPNRVVHGAVIFALADIGMGSAVHATLAEGELCATVEIKINYFKPVREGDLICTTVLVNRGKTLANLDSSIHCGDLLVAKANGTYAVFRPSQPKG